MTRDKNKKIIAISERKTNPNSELLPKDHPEIQPFLEKNQLIREQKNLQRTDGDLVRVTEDLIDLLIAKNIINFTDLPRPAQIKLITRQKLRRNVAALKRLAADKDSIV